MWQLKYALLQVHFASAVCPPGSESALGRWILKQKARLAAGSLSPEQIDQLRRICNWDLTKREWRRLCRRQQEQERLELETMHKHDVDTNDAMHRCAVICQDREISQLSREDTRTKTPPCFKLSLPELVTRCLRSGAPMPVTCLVLLPMGVLYQGLVDLPSDFHRIADVAAVNAAFAKCTDLGRVRVAYSVPASYECPGQARRLPWRPLTFEDFARSFPAQSISLVYNHQMYPESVLGQPASFVSYLKEIDFVGGVWLPGSCIRPHWGTTVDTTHIRFDSSCRVRSGHVEACRRHHTCVCGLNEAEAQVALRQKGHCWPRGAEVSCLCTPSESEVINWLHTSASVCVLSEVKVIHWSTALGLKPCASERQRDMLQRGRLLLFAT